MAAVNSTNSNPSTVSNQYFGVTAASKTQGLDINTFINLLVSELQNQDPTQPMSQSDMFSQMSQLGQVQGINQLTTNSQAQEAQSLVGKSITALYTDPKSSLSTPIKGVVVGASLSNGSYSLSLEGSDGTVKTVALSDVQSVQPSLNTTDAASMIGRTVTGSITSGTGSSASTVSVTGQVTSISQSGGTLYLNVQTKDKGTVQMPTNAVTSVSS